MKSWIALVSLLLLTCECALGSKPDTTIILTNTPVDIKYPYSVEKACILVLPGWNFSQDDICIKSDFCTKALNKGYVLIMPDMQKSIYTCRKYNETRADWQKYHSLLWITDTLVPYLQTKFSLLLNGKKNFLFGISTGARGVAMLSIYSPDVFIAGAALSGDYDPESMQNDNLLKGFLGPLEKNIERWTISESPINNSDRIKIPLFVAHGNSDNIVPVSQTISFYNKLKKRNTSHIVMHIAKEGGHDYAFWSSEYESIFIFFEKIINP